MQILLGQNIEKGIYYYDAIHPQQNDHHRGISFSATQTRFHRFIYLNDIKFQHFSINQPKKNQK